MPFFTLTPTLRTKNHSKSNYSNSKCVCGHRMSEDTKGDPQSKHKAGTSYSCECTS